MLAATFALLSVVAVARRADARVFFGPPNSLNFATSQPGHTAWIATDGAGTWVTMWTRNGPDEVFFRRSVNGGLTWSFPPTTVDPMAGSDTRAEREVTLAAGGGSTWIAVYQSRDTAGSPDADIRLARSTDGGATWSTQYLDPNAGSDVREDTEPFVATDGAGTWIVIWTVRETGADPDFRPFTARSTNDGVTWSAPAPLTSDAPLPSFPVPAPQLAYAGAGVWVATWTSVPVEPYDSVLVARSADGGATWSPPTGLNANDAEPGHSAASRLASDGAGNLVAAWATKETLGGTLAPGALHVVAARSTDSGATWSFPAAVDARAGTDPDIMGLHLRLATDGAGTWAAVWGTFSDGAAAPFHSGVVMARSTDGGASWTIPTTMDQEITERDANAFDPHLAGDPGRFIGVWTRREDADFEEDNDTIDYAIAEPLCPPAPLPGCRTGAAGQLTIRDWSADRKDRLAWSWFNGAETMLGDFGDPFNTTDYSVCLYDAGDRVLLGSRAPAGGTCGTVNCWRPQGSNAIAYRDGARTPYGMDKMKLQAGAAGKAKIKLTARGVYLSTPVLRFLSFPLVFQLQASNGECWEATYNTAAVNTPGQLKAKVD
jgi:hypothetical protein